MFILSNDQKKFMKSSYLSKLFYLPILVLGLTGIYLLISYSKFEGFQFIFAILILLLISVLYKYFNPEGIPFKVLKIILISAGFFYSFIIIGSRFLYFNKIKNNRSYIHSQSYVNFEKTNFQTSMIKAKKEGKFIFLDIYTGWCGPCLNFSKTVLRDNEVSERLNSKFINLKYDAEVAEGIMIDKKYGKGGYPVILILDGDGNVKEDICKNGIPDTETMKLILGKYE